MGTVAGPPIRQPLSHPRLEKVGPYLAIATLQAYTVLTVVRGLADPVWIVYKNGGQPPTGVAEIGGLEKIFLALAIGFTMLSCLGVTLRILDKLPWLRKIPVITAYLEACIITVLFASIVAVMLTIDWRKGFPSAGLSATLKALIISSFVMTTVIIIGAAIYSALEGWTFDEAVNFCIVSFATIGYGNLSPKTTAGRIIFFFYGLLGISSLGFFVVSLRNAVVEQFQWRLLDRFSKPAHMTRVQTRMSTKDISFPEARLEEEQRVKKIVKRKMIIRMLCIWVVMWFGGAGIFVALEYWTYLEALYFCFVTLTTIGFGDYVPTSPGAIEFWNVYVFLGLAVFAYILSISSESMMTHIHLVDDQVDNDDEMYGWERNEDPNAPLTTHSGILGLEGLKWPHHHQHLQQQDYDNDMRVDDEGKPIEDGNGGGQNSSTIDRYSTPPFNRSKQKSSSGRVLMVSAKERKQMLQAEYYATHSLPTAIRFIDTSGMPHQRTIGRTMTSDGTSDVRSRGMSIQPGYVYDTVGYHGTIGRRDFRQGSTPRRMHSVGGVAIDHYGTMYGSGSAQTQNTVQTHQLQHQPLIRFDSPTASVRSQRGRNRDRQDRYDDQYAGGTGNIPSVMDVFRHDSTRGAGVRAGEGSSREIHDLSAAEESPVIRVRSNSLDMLASDEPRVGPTQNEIHRWIAEDAGTLQGPNFNFGSDRSPEPLDDNSKAIRFRNSQSSETTRVTSPPLAKGVETYFEGAHPAKQSTDSKRGSLVYHREGIAPDEIPMSWSSEPATISAERESESRSNQDDVVQDSLGSGSGSGGNTRRESIAPPTITGNDSSVPTQGSPNHLFLGGGVGAGYGPHAYGVPFPGVGTESQSGIAAGGESSALGPIQLFDDDDDHPYCVADVDDSQPRSLFSNYPRSPGQNNSGVPAPSELITIFNEPVRDLPRSRSASTANSPSHSRSRAGSEARMPSGRSSGQSTPTIALTLAALQAHSLASPRPPQGSRASLQSQASSEISIGPFNETRDAETIPRFEQDVDLNRTELQPEQYAEERRRRRDLRRREREIEARLARLGAKGREDSYQ
ncbi:Potassium channel [Dissophora globulifera]|nr:Potassium channel [Dissophora globulifera]